MSNIELAMMHSPDSIVALLDKVRSTAEWAANMVEQLMIFSRQGIPDEKELLPFNAVVNNAAEICREMFDRKIDIRVNLRAEPLVLGNAGQLQQALLNLCLNARDALKESQPAQPSLAISVDTVENPSDHPGTYVRVCVEDNGAGMDAERIEHIFDPFFTTKEEGKGTGLGLSTVYGITQHHDGWIECTSQHQKGSSFSVYLPASGDAIETPEPEDREKGDAEEITGGTETLLFIEDEAELRRLTARVLQQYGYSVLEGVDGLDGLAVFRRERERIDLVLIDLSMPRLSGTEVLTHLHSLYPNLKVVVFTGHGIDDKDLTGAAAILIKPCRMFTLLRTVRQVLDT